MIGHRDGHAVTLCDGCYRPKRTGERDWQRSPEGGLPESSARPQAPSGQGTALAAVVQPVQPLDYCPSCAAGLGASES